MKKEFKLQPVYIRNRWRENIGTVPKLTMQGHWLKEAGFKVSDVVTVIVEEGKLTIVNS